MDRVVFTSNPKRRCGVYEFGHSTFAALERSTKYRYVYEQFEESTTSEQFCERIAAHQPVAVIHNWHPFTMPWLSDDVLVALHRRCPHVRHAMIVHDVPAPFHFSDGAIFNDPTHQAGPGEYVVSRRLFPRPEPTTDPGPVIGSFGFGLNGKGFQRIIDCVNAEFDHATVRLHIPGSDYCDKKGSQKRRVIDQCRAAAKPGINVEISSDYLDTPAMLDWLAGNAVNCFFYDDFPGRGISSVIDFALSARRPIAITRSDMFRHVVNMQPSVVIGETSLKQIIANGLTPWRPLLAKWTDENLAAEYDCAVDGIRAQPMVDLTSNRVLTPRDRERLRPSIEQMHELCPDIMSRKFPQAVFQNAFIFEQAKHLLQPGDRIILIGGYEDPIGPCLRQLGYDVTITDPQVDGRDSYQVLHDCLKSGDRYEMVISCSVLEHVEEDTVFIKTLYELLKPGGIALLTTDFKYDWQPGVPKPTPDVRLYTPERLQSLASALPEGSMLSAADWQRLPAYFHYDGADYGFCSLAFRRAADDVSDRFARELMLHSLLEVGELRRRLAIKPPTLRDKFRSWKRRLRAG